MSVLQRLTEGVINRDLSRENQALLTKWEKTGLLEGLDNDRQRQGMAVLLENQAKELLREASSMAAGDVEGFAAVAFPIVRRVFGGLIANDLVSVQPMSLPSGLIFFLDFTHQDARGGAVADASLYGGNVVGRQITGGVKLSPSNGSGPGGFYDMGHGYTSPTASAAVSVSRIGAAASLASAFSGSTITLLKGRPTAERDRVMKRIRRDADILSHPAPGTAQIAILAISASVMAPGGALAQLDRGALHAVSASFQNGTRLVRRLTQLDDDGNLILVALNEGGAVRLAGGNNNWQDSDANDFNDVAAGDFAFPIVDSFVNSPNADAMGAIAGTDTWGLEEPAPSTGNTSRDGAAGAATKNTIPEIDIKVDSIAVTAQTKKLKAKWSPELGQDLNAYHNLDAEVELTGILSEQIALEIDREILSELVQGATAGTRYWSRAPGLFLDADGAEVGQQSAAPDFTGTVSEWYETLVETINDVSAQIHRKTLRGGANFLVVSPEVANILEFTSGFRASITADQDRGTVGAVKAGSLSKKWDVYVDPYFLRNVVLVGRKGSSFLESGFVYAPYVPLQVTPTIFGTEDFVPRKGVMTRYAKKMVRPDLYGLVVVRGLLGESGS